MFKLEINGKEYTLEVTRRSIKKAEELGISLDKTGFGMTYDIFYIAISKHHPELSLEQAYDLYDTVIDSGEYDPKQILDLIAQQLESVLAKLDNPKAKKKLKNA